LGERGLLAAAVIPSMAIARMLDPDKVAGDSACPPSKNGFNLTRAMFAYSVSTRRAG